MKKIKINNIEIGSGMPKIVIPIVGKTEQQLLDEVDYLLNNKIIFDIIEWRVDHFLGLYDINKVKSIAQQLNTILVNKPLLFTLRTENDSNIEMVCIDDYMRLNITMIQSGLVNIVDIEAYKGDQYVKRLIDEAHKNQVYTIGSYHDFHHTPTKEEIINRLLKIQNTGVDIVKIALMPKSASDVLALLAATVEMNDSIATRPIATMSMGALGMISRITGETFASALTFGSAKTASAPGQLNAQDLHTILDILHHSQ